MLIKDALIYGRKMLNNTKCDAPGLVSGVLLSYVMERDRVWLYSHDDLDIAAECVEEYKRLLQRSAAGEPLAYITGSKEFMGIEFKVGAGVLIPRPETELLVEKTIEICKRNPDKKYKILDLCSGSGCISISTAKYLMNYGIDFEIKGLDISDKALFFSNMNAGLNKVEEKVRFYKGDIFHLEKPAYKYDIIVSNPPYIKSSDIDLLEDTVKVYEPSLALDGGEDGLDFYRNIISGLKDMLKSDGAVIIEIGIKQSEEICRMLETNGMSAFVYKDYANIDRIIEARWKNA